MVLHIWFLCDNISVGDLSFPEVPAFGTKVILIIAFESAPVRVQHLVQVQTAVCMSVILLIGWGGTILDRKEV